LPRLIAWYNKERPHQALDYLTPAMMAEAVVDKLSNLPTTTQPHQQLV
jgi:transposase InsO family protein